MSVVVRRHVHDVGVWRWTHYRRTTDEPSSAVDLWCMGATQRPQDEGDDSPGAHLLRSPRGVDRCADRASARSDEHLGALGKRIRRDSAHGGAPIRDWHRSFCGPGTRETDTAAPRPCVPRPERTAVPRCRRARRRSCRSLPRPALGRTPAFQPGTGDHGLGDARYVHVLILRFSDLIFVRVSFALLDEHPEAPKEVIPAAHA